MKQESLFCWFQIPQRFGDNHTWLLGTIVAYPNDVYQERISAFTVAELGEMLPKGYVSGITFFTDEGRHAICHWYQVDTTGALIPELEVNANVQAPADKFCEADTEANARAKMLCYLLENKLLEIR